LVLAHVLLHGCGGPVLVGDEGGPVVVVGVGAADIPGIW
jgi:hypothetical protein